jgi:beta-phosphoglucomutase-like phosphatase (HAD superfamily)
VSRGLFIDLDGTLADTLPMLRRVYVRFLSECGVNASDEEFETINGPPLNRVVEILKGRHQLAPPVERLLGRYMELVRENYLDAAPSDGGAELLATAVRQGWRCAVVTSNAEAISREWLEKNKLSASIFAVIGKESVRVGKPDPEPYLVALERLDCRADHSIAVEDSNAGIAAAAAAFIPTFAYRPETQHPAPPVDSAPTIASLRELIPWL